MHLDDKTHEGIALIIRSDIKDYESLCKFQKEFLQATNIVVEDRNGEILLFQPYTHLKLA